MSRAQLGFSLLCPSETSDTTAFHLLNTTSTLGIVSKINGALCCFLCVCVFEAAGRPTAFFVSLRNSIHGFQVMNGGLAVTDSRLRFAVKYASNYQMNWCDIYTRCVNSEWTERATFRFHQLPFPPRLCSWCGSLSAFL